MAGYRRRKPLVSFEYGTRIHAPSEGERRFRVVATDSDGQRVFAKFTTEGPGDRVHPPFVAAHRRGLRQAVQGPRRGGAADVGACHEAQAPIGPAVG